MRPLKRVHEKKHFDWFSYWTDLFLVCIIAIIYYFLKPKIYVLLFLLSISIIGILVYLIKATRKSFSEGIRRHPFSHAEMRAIRKVQNEYKSSGDATKLYHLLNDNILPRIRDYLPSKVYKYYSLDINKELNNKKIEALKCGNTWASLYPEFNDPFEGKFLYLNENDIEALGMPSNSIEVWKLIMDILYKRITAICFTATPNSMPMWAHYANNHKGFCVEYDIVKKDNFYGVIYVDKRKQGLGLFLNLVYDLFVEKDATKTGIIKYIMLLSSFKDSSWKEEKEIRAIMISPHEVKNGGQLFSCNDIGIKPSKIYIGAFCKENYVERLTDISHYLDIPCDHCMVSNNEYYDTLQN